MIVIRYLSPALVQVLWRRVGKLEWFLHNRSFGPPLPCGCNLVSKVDLQNVKYFQLFQIKKQTSKLNIVTRLHPQGKGGPKDRLCRNHSNFPANVSARHNYSGERREWASGTFGSASIKYVLAKCPKRTRF